MKKKTKGVVDVVFCLDASESMEPCFDGVKNHISSFVEGLRADGQQQWDVRFDFVAHYTLLNVTGGTVVCQSSTYNEFLLDALYGNVSGKFFTRDVEEFKRALNRVKTMGDEGPMVALDSCLDFPWREAGICHRVVIFMSDEPFETCANPADERQFIPELTHKVMGQKVLLFMVAPDSEGYEQLTSADKSEYVVLEDGMTGMADVDFGNLLSQIGKSVSANPFGQQGPANRTAARRGIFGQGGWSVSEGVETHDRTSLS